ncbi:MAG: hypothetical protein H7Y37_20465 [Anaerolineae bacterium]|nr:hypothetical protein [Gloeobacterales cyanobacterium ES-bin-313]
MTFKSYWFSLLLVLVAALPGAAQTTTCLPATTQPADAPPDQVVQDFPAGGKAETGWKITYGRAVGKGLYITGAYFRRTPSEPYTQVLYDARLADIFAPYDPGTPRYYDLTGFNFRLVPVSSVDLGSCGSKLDRYVVKEIRDREMLWKDDKQGRRAQEMTIWGTLDASNYNYIMRYGFQDDGTITFRLGATAYNLPGHELVAHTHDGLWKIDMDLGGAKNNLVQVARHLQSKDSFEASYVISPFGDGYEDYLDWLPEEYTELHVINTSIVNANGNPIGYDLKPMRSGSPRHFEAFSHHDFWATVYKENEIIYDQVPTYVNGESLSGNDSVIWYQSSVYHIPHDEDGRYVNNVWQGVALVMWTGFDLRPRNFFSKTPLYP